MYKIYAYEGNPNSRKSLIAGKYGGIEISYPSGFKMGTDNKTEEFLKKNPSGQVPMMETPDGPIFESNAMAKYIARKGNDKGLYGSNDYQASLVDQWCEFYTTHFSENNGIMVSMARGYRPYNQTQLENAFAGLEKKLPLLERYFDEHEYFVGNRVTVADIIVWVSFSGVAGLYMTPNFITKFPHFKKWFERCASQKQFLDVVKFEWPTKAPEFKQ